MTHLRRWTAQFVAISIYLLAIFAVGQDPPETPCTNWENWRFDAILPEEQWVINADEILQCIKEGKDIDIDNAVIKGDFDLSKLPTESAEDYPNEQVIYVKGEVAIVNSRFEGEVNPRIRESNTITPIIFKQDTRFSFTTFSGRTYFSYTTFSESIYFSNVIFSESARFIGATFSGRANFIGANFFQYTDFLATTFLEPLILLTRIFLCSLSFTLQTFLTMRVFQVRIFMEAILFSLRIFLTMRVFHMWIF